MANTYDDLTDLDQKIFQDTHDRQYYLGFTIRSIAYQYQEMYQKLLPLPAWIKKFIKDNPESEKELIQVKNKTFSTTQEKQKFIKQHEKRSEIISISSIGKSS